jgi:nucleoporin POM152
MAKIPIQFNASLPAEIDILRIDLDTMQQEILKVSKAEIRQIAKSIKAQSDPNSFLFTWEYPVKKTGVYRLDKVLDEYKLQVDRRSRDTYVVPCPSARIQTRESSKRCIRDLSDLSVEVQGTPPMRITYSRMINGQDHSVHLQSLQPDGFTSPLLGSPASALIHADEDDVSWVRPLRVQVPLNETLHATGEWKYTVDEVTDAFGNVVSYTRPGEDADVRPRPKHLVHEFVVKQRPRVFMKGCENRTPIKAARGEEKELPVRYIIPGQGTDDTSHTLTWDFSPIDSLTDNGDHGAVVTAGSYSAKNSMDRPIVSSPGLYTLRSVASDSCEGEVQEPSSCLLENPPEPRVSLRAEEILDKCAGNSIGLRVDLDLTGTPPFAVRYDVVTNHGDVLRETVSVAGLRTQIELTPREGHHKYIFKEVSDAVYKGQPLVGPGMVLEQTVKRAASAAIHHPKETISACLEQEVEVEVLLRGDAPFTLEYELVRDGKRKSEKISGIDKGGIYKIKTPPLAKGGEYIFALSSVQDKAGCRTFLKEELKISVRRQRPRAGFGTIENKFKITAVEDSGINLPVRLQGVGPWTVSYRNMNGSNIVVDRVLRSGNANLMVKSRGIYEIVGVSDNQCPGTVDPKASTFEVDWYPRPQISVVSSESISQDPSGVAVKQEVCEGDIDGFEIALQGKSSPNKSKLVEKE